MSQNRSAAVMNQRHEPHDSLDDFPTPPWATRALCEKLLERGYDLPAMSAWDPCCNRGFMVKPMREYFGSVFATDVHDYGWDGMDAQADFLMPWGDDNPDVDIICMNFPFRLGLDFILQGLRLARVGVAVFARTNFVEGQERYEQLFSRTPERHFFPFVERVVLWKGVLLDPDVKIANWKAKKKRFEIEKPTSATSYSWSFFSKDPSGHCDFERIAPCRRNLTRPGDYPPLPAHLDPKLVVQGHATDPGEAYQEGLAL